VARDLKMWKDGSVAPEPDDEFASFYETEFPAVFRAASLLAGDVETGRDAAQEAFARALARWRRLRNQPWAGGWVTTTALNLVRRGLRRRPEPGPPRSAAATPVEEAVDLRRAIAELPARQREAVVLRYLLDLSMEEVAGRMGCAEGTARVHLTRARRALSRHLGGARVEE
jgi:RNA polymerase sigma factor (sigma-70 family)